MGLLSHETDRLMDSQSTITKEDLFFPTHLRELDEKAEPEEKEDNSEINDRKKPIPRQKTRIRKLQKLPKFQNKTQKFFHLKENPNFCFLLLLGAIPIHNNNPNIFCHHQISKIILKQIQKLEVLINQKQRELENIHNV